MNIYEDKCDNCGKLFLNNSGCTSWGCSDYCDALLRAEDFCLHTFGAPQRCPYVINPDASGEDCEPCGKEAKYAFIVNYAEWKPTVAFCKSHFWVVWNKVHSMANELHTRTYEGDTGETVVVVGNRRDISHIVPEVIECEFVFRHGILIDADIVRFTQEDSDGLC